MAENSSSQTPELRRTGTDPSAAHGRLRAFCEAVLELMPSDSSAGSILVETLPSVLPAIGKCCDSRAPLREEFASWREQSKRLIHLATLHSSSASQVLVASLDEASVQGTLLLDALDELAAANLESQSSPAAPMDEPTGDRQQSVASSLEGLRAFCLAVHNLQPGESDHESVLTQMFPSLLQMFERCGPVELAGLRSELKASEDAADQLVKLAAFHCDSAAADLQRRVGRAHANAARVIDALEDLHVASLGESAADSAASSIGYSESVLDHDDEEPAPGGPTSESDREQAEIFCQMAGRCHQRHELSAAERLYSDAIRLDANQRLAWLHRGRIRLLGGQIESSIADLTRAIGLLEGDYLAHRWRGDAFAVRGRFEEAAADYSRSLELSPDSNVVRYNRAVVFRQAGRLDQAWSELDQLVRQEPRSAPLYLNRGLICLTRGQREEAIREFRAALVHCPDSKEAQDRLKELGAFVEPAPPAVVVPAPIEKSGLALSSPVPTVPAASAEIADQPLVPLAADPADRGAAEPDSAAEIDSAKHRTSVFEIVVPAVAGSSQDTIPLRIDPPKGAIPTADEPVISIPHLSDDEPASTAKVEDVFEEFYGANAAGKGRSSPTVSSQAVKLPMAALEDASSAVAAALPSTPSAPAAAIPSLDGSSEEAHAAEPSPFGDGFMEVKCPVCGAQSTVRWDRLKKGKVLGCPHCRRSFTPLPNGQLSEVVKSADGRWNLPVKESFRPTRSHFAMLAFGLLAVVGSVLVAPSLLRSSTPVAIELPDDLEPRAKLFGECWLKKDYESIRLMTFPEQAPKLFAWHRANPAPERSRNVQIDVTVTKETPPLAELALRFEGHELDNGEKKIAMTWKEHNKEWMFVPDPKELSKPSGRPRRGPFGPSSRLSVR